MRPSLRLVIGGLCATIVLVVAIITLAITYTVSLETVRSIGKKHALALATTARVQTDSFFEIPTIASDAIADVHKHFGNVLSVELTDPTDPIIHERLLYTLYIAHRTSNFSFSPVGTFMEDGAGTSSYINNDRTRIECISRFVHNWPNGNMSTIFRSYDVATGMELVRDEFSTTFPHDLDLRFGAYYIAKSLVGANPNGMWFPVSVYDLLTHVEFIFPSAKPIFNRTNDFVGFVLLGQPLSQISSFLGGVRGTPNTQVFAIQDDGFLVGSTHPVPFFTISEQPASATVPRGCAATTGTDIATLSRPTFHGCRTNALDFPYAPLRAAATDGIFATTKGSRVRLTDVGKESFFIAYTSVNNRYRFFSLTIVLCMPEADILGDLVSGRNTAIGVTAAVFVVAALLSFGLVWFLLKPLTDVSRRMLNTARLKDATDARDYSPLAEVQDLQMAYTTMNTAIKSFTRYVPREVVKDLMASGQLCEIKMTPIPCTMLFVDIAGFTTVCERVPPELLSDLVSQYFDRASRIVMEHDGLIDKFIGDCIMAVWGAPFEVAHQEIKATLAGKLLDRETMVAPLSTAWDDAGELLRVRVGIATGEVLAGNMGSADRMNYTVIGDPVNLAARLESMNKQFGTRVMVSEDTADGLHGTFILRLLLPIAVVGKAKPVKVFEVLGLSPDAVASLEAAPVATFHATGAREAPGDGSDTGSDASSVRTAGGSAVVRRSKRTTAQMLRDAALHTASTLPLTCDQAVIAFGRAYTAAANQYILADFPKALATLGAALDANPAAASACEVSASLLRDLCEKYVRDGVPADYDGTYRALEK